MWSRLASHIDTMYSLKPKIDEKEKKPFEEKAFDFYATIFEANQNLFDSTS